MATLIGPPLPPPPMPPSPPSPPSPMFTLEQAIAAIEEMEASGDPALDELARGLFNEA